MKTRAVIFQEACKPVLGEIEMPPPASGEVQVRTTVSVISVGTERWALRNLFTWQQTPFPCVPGYQRAGVIAALGAGVTGLMVGQRVMATVGSWDGDIKPSWGAHAGLINTRAEEVYALPDTVSDLDAAGAVVAQVGYNAASRLLLNPGDWVLVYGDGLIGQCAAQAARARGARVILAGHHEGRLELARTSSADSVLNTKTDSPAGFVNRSTDSQGAAGVLDTVQSEAAQQEYIPLLRSPVPSQMPEMGTLTHAQVVYCGFTPGKTWADMGLLQQRELTCHFVSGWTRPRMEATLVLMESGQMQLAPLITHHVSCEEGPRMYEMMLANDEAFLGIALAWT